MKINHLFFLSLLASIFTVTGCANTNKDAQLDNSNMQLQAVQEENVSLIGKIKGLTQSLHQKDEELGMTKTKLSAAEMALAGTARLPSGSNSGDCFGLANDGKSLMKSICASALTPDMVKSIQRALSGSGYNPGPIDGIIGSKTMAAVNGYQKAKSLMQGSLTQETLNSLGVM